ncbi:MAG: cyanophycinase [Pseudobacteriovorax sp.]|nr:cyanophycinase [Pseudobacteriovorax sp.]
MRVCILFCLSLTIAWACTPKPSPSPDAPKTQNPQDNNQGDKDTERPPVDEPETPKDPPPQQAFDESKLTDAAVVNFTSGSTTDKAVNLTAGAGGLLLMGGGLDVDAAFSNRVKAHFASSAAIDVVVLRTTGTDGYNDYLLGLLGANSVRTFVADSKDKANNRELYQALKGAEFIWLAGGDQSEYHRFWTGTAIQFFIQDLYQRGGVVGGTSAGMATLSPISYNPDGVAGAITAEVIPDFCHETVKFTENFFSTTFPQYLTDTHFAERDRLGRLGNFLGHHPNVTPIGIAADENASIFLTTDGRGVVDGAGSVYILDTKAMDASGSACGGVTSVKNIQKTKLVSGQVFNVKTGLTDGTTEVFSIDGALDPSYNPENPY